ncbi:MAG: PKD domain-containing protein [Bacteroidetes bacterium]|nr:PKD domain-containing protein [Bacteroidota bacterium]
MIKAQLGGVYYVDPSKASDSVHYKSIYAVVLDLDSGKRNDGGKANGPGVGNAVVIKIADGTYKGSYVLNAISGVSASNTITLISQSGDSSKVVLMDSAGKPVFYISESYISIKNISIKIGSKTVLGLEYEGFANNNSVENCSISGISGIGSTLIGFGVKGRGSGVFNNTLIKNNLIIYGFNGILFWGQGDTGNIIDGNQLLGLYTAIDLIREIDPVIKNNYITSAFVSLAGVTSGAQIFNNKFIKCYIYADLRGTTTGKDFLFANNYYLADVSPSQFNIAYGSNTYNFYNNTLIVADKIFPDSNGKTGFIFSFIYGGQNLNLKNNCFVNFNNSRKNTVLHLQNMSSATVNSDYNNFYCTGGNIIRDSANNYLDLKTWQKATSLDSHTLSVDPLFWPKDNYHITNVLLNGKGIPIKGIGKDLDNEMRDTLLPDIGADEFFPCANDAGIMHIDSPALGICAGKRDVYVTLRNYGLNALTSVTINWKINGVAQTPYAFSSSLAINEDSVFKIGSINISSGKIYSFSAKTSNPNGVKDCDTTNDSAQLLNIQSGMGGVYSIGGTKPDYTTFTAAVADLTAHGLCTSAIFNMADGVYNERVTIPAIGGSSPNKTIIFKSASGDSSKVILQYANVLPNEPSYIVGLFGASYIEINKLTLKSTSTSVSKLILIGELTHHITILKNRLIGLKSINVASMILLSNYNSNIVIKNNDFRFANTGISFRYDYSCLVQGNRMDSINSIGILVSFPMNIKIIDNRINVGGNSLGVSGIIISSNKGYTEVSGNIISLLGNTNSGNVFKHGIYINYFSQATTDSTVITNNFLSNINGRCKGISLNGNHALKVFHNSISIDKTSDTGSFAIYPSGTFSSSNGNFIYNNNLSNKANPKNIIYTKFYKNISDEDYNNFGDTASLNYWRKTTGMGKHSVGVNPRFKSNTDLHCKQFLLKNKGLHIAGISTDIDGDLRDTAKPDIGADEFTLFNNDVGVSDIISPDKSSCGDSFTNVSLVISNYGKNAVGNYPVKIKVNGGSVLSIVIKDTLRAGYDTLISFSKTFNTYAGGKYLIQAFTDLSADPDRSDDTFSKTYFAFPYTQISSIKTYPICGANKVTFVATSPNKDSISWYDAATGGNLLHTGNSFTTPTLSATKTYWVQPDAGHSKAAPVDVYIGNRSGISVLNNFGLRFDALHDITIDTLRIYPMNKGLVKLSVLDSAANIIAQWADTVTPSTITFDTFISPKLYVPQGKNYRIILDGSICGGFFYNTSGCKYPYLDSTKKLLLITSAANGDTSIYPPLYDWKISDRPSCISPRIKVTATPSTGAKPKADFTTQNNSCMGDISTIKDNSSITSGSIAKWEYEFGDGKNTTSKIQGDTTHYFSKNGSYKITQTITSSGGCFDTLSKTINVNNLPDDSFTLKLISAAATELKAKDTTLKKYYWQYPDGTKDSTSGFKSTHSFSKNISGYFHLKVKDKNDCISEDSLFAAITSLAENTQENRIEIAPNPFRESTNISYFLTSENKVKISVMDALERTVLTLINSNQTAGEHSLNFTVPSAGVYFLHITIGDEVMVKRVVRVW